MDILHILGFIIFIYLVIGLVLYYNQEKWVEENDPDFFSEIDNVDYLRYLLSSVVMWGPCLVKYFKNNTKN